MADRKSIYRICLDGWQPGTSLLDFLVTSGVGFSRFYSSGDETFIEFKDIYCENGHKKISNNAYIRPNRRTIECRQCRTNRPRATKG